MDAREQELLALMNQNIRGPLYSILELARLAKERCTDDEELTRCLDRIAISGDLMSDAIDDIVALRQILSNHVSLHPERIFLRDFLEKSAHHLSIALSDKGIGFSTVTHGIESLIINADYTVLSQTLRKFVQSVSAYLTRGSRETLHITGGDVTGSESVSIEFALHCYDVTMKPERFSTLLLPYEEFRLAVASNSIAHDLDFMILRSYAHEMGTDEISVAKNGDLGLTVSMTLSFPLAFAPGADIQIHDFDFRGKRVLLADDDTINLEIVERLLREKHAEVISVRDGKETLHAYRADHGDFDLILIDIVMPDISGLEVARNIRATSMIPRSRTVPIIAMTANAFDENYAESRAAGMNAHLVKPIDPERLYRQVEEYL